MPDTPVYIDSKMQTALPMPSPTVNGEKTAAHGADHPGPTKYAIACAIKSFLSRLGLSVKAAEFDPTGVVSKRLRDEVSRWDLGGLSLEKCEPYILCGIHLGSGPYAHTSIDAQIQIAKYTFILLCVDEFEVPTAALEEFMGRLYTGAHQLHQVLNVLVDILRQMQDSWSPFLVTQIVKSTVDFINSVVLDERTEAMVLQPCALRYVDFKRFYNGIGEAYAAFVWDKVNFPDMFGYLQALPDMNIFCDYVNDIFSFYKEELGHETKNFVHDRAFVTGKDVASALYDIVNETVLSVDNVRQILRGDKEKRVWEDFINRYLAFHIETPRYRLHEILGYGLPKHSRECR